MKKFILTIVLVVLCSVNNYSQAKKPTIMVVPSDNWCIKNGYFLEFDNQGTVEVIPDYKKAFQDNTELLMVVSKINGLMAEREFPLKNIETVMKSKEKAALKKR